MAPCRENTSKALTYGTRSQGCTLRLEYQTILLSVRAYSLAIIGIMHKMNYNMQFSNEKLKKILWKGLA